MATRNAGFGGSRQSRNLLPTMLSWPPGQSAAWLALDMPRNDEAAPSVTGHALQDARAGCLTAAVAPGAAELAAEDGVAAGRRPSVASVKAPADTLGRDPDTPCGLPTEIPGV
jgi:hypothetical protein